MSGSRLDEIQKMQLQITVLQKRLQESVQRERDLEQKNKSQKKELTV